MEEINTRIHNNSPGSRVITPTWNMNLKKFTGSVKTLIRKDIVTTPFKRGGTGMAQGSSGADTCVVRTGTV
jgi:F420-0:gamma-glutamyl ligase